MGEKAKRLKPKENVLRELYSKSGNQCAFPGCNSVLCDEKGNFIGQICHIEAAEEGGERFNPNMSNEERRSYDNLMLMCYKHHVITNNVNEYPVSKLKKMKKDHEEKFSGATQSLCVDYGVATNFTESKICQALSDTLEFHCSETENAYNSHILNNLLSRLIDVPIETRMFLSIMVKRSFTYNEWECRVPLNEIQVVTQKDDYYIIYQLDILRRRGLVSEQLIDDFNCPFCILLPDRETGWSYWDDIREYCKKSNISTDDILVNLDFSLFD